MDSRQNTPLRPLVISLAIGLLALVVAFILLARAFGEDEVRVGKRAPDFTLKDTKGNVVKLADFTGKALIVSFVVTWDEPSLKQIAILSDLHKGYDKKDLAVLAVAIEETDKQTTRAYVEQQHPGFPFLVANYETIRAFGGLTAVPTTFVIDKDRNIIQRHVGITNTNVLEADLKGINPQ